MPRCVAWGSDIPAVFAASAITAGQVVLGEESLTLFLLFEPGRDFDTLHSTFDQQLVLIVAAIIAAVAQGVDAHSKDHNFAASPGVTAGLLPEHASGFPVRAPTRVSGVSVAFDVFSPPIPADSVRDNFAFILPAP